MYTHYLGEVETFIILCGKYSLLKTISTKFYQNRPGFVDDMTKNIWCVWGFAVSIAVHLQNANAKFHKVVWRHYSGELKYV